MLAITVTAAIEARLFRFMLALLVSAPVHRGVIGPSDAHRGQTTTKFAADTCGMHRSPTQGRPRRNPSGPSRPTAHRSAAAVNQTAPPPALHARHGAARKLLR